MKTAMDNNATRRATYTTLLGRTRRLEMLEEGDHDFLTARHPIPAPSNAATTSSDTAGSICGRYRPAIPSDIASGRRFAATGVDRPTFHPLACVILPEKTKDNSAVTANSGIGSRGAMSLVPAMAKT